MADDLTVDNGAGTDYDVATDDDGSGNHMQIVKLGISTDGSRTLIPSDGTDGMLVNLGANNDVTVSGVSTSAKQDTIIGHLDGVEGLLTTIDGDTGTLAGAVAGTEMQVDIVSAPTITVDSELTTADLDTGAGTDTRAVVGLVGAASGGGALIEGTAANGLEVDVTRVSGTVTVDGSGVTQPVSHAALTELAAAIDTEVQVDIVGALPAGTNAIGKLAANSGVDIGDVDVTTVGTITPGTAATSLGKAEDAQHGSGDVGVYALGVRDTQPAAHSNADGDYESLHVSDEGGLWSAEVASAYGGCDAFFTYDADETEEDVKTSAGSVYGWYIYNDGAAEVYVRLYNATAANTTVGSTAAKIVLPIPAGSAANMSFSPGIKFDTAICIAATTATGAADASAPAANQVTATIFYK